MIERIGKNRHTAAWVEDIPITVQPELARHLDGFIQPARLETMARVLDSRTRYATVVMENLYQSHNFSAIIRTTEAMGLQSAFVIESQNRFRLAPSVAVGAENWIELYRFRGHADQPTRDCFQHLRQIGYRIAVADPVSSAIPLEELPVNQPIALCFGTEWEGLSTIARQEADLHFAIPMHGFTKSLNVSVSAALTLHRLRQRLDREVASLSLPPADRERIWLEWLIANVRRGQTVAQRFLGSLDQAGGGGGGNSSAGSS